jgi:DNA-binding GntR family transcriptional regulator
MYEKLRADLLSGQFSAGEQLRTKPLCLRYEVSLSVVREALCRLAEQGLVQANRNRGFSVPRLELEEFEDLTLARVTVEPICLRQSIVHGDSDWEAACIVAFHRVRRNPPSIDKDLASTAASLNANAVFHATLCSGCRSTRLLAIRNSLSDAAIPYRVWSVAAMSAARDTEAEHEALLNAALERDVDLACSIAVDHINVTAQALINAIRRKRMDEEPPKANRDGELAS